MIETNSNFLSAISFVDFDGKALVAGSRLGTTTVLKESKALAMSPKEVYFFAPRRMLLVNSVIHIELRFK